MNVRLKNRSQDFVYICFLILLFQSVSRVLTKLPNGSWEHVPSSRADVFATKHVSVVEKRILMKFINFSVNYESQPEIYENFVGKTYLEFLNHERLTENLIHFVLHSIGMVLIILTH